MASIISGCAHKHKHAEDYIEELTKRVNGAETKETATKAVLDAIKEFSDARNNLIREITTSTSTTNVLTKDGTVIGTVNDIAEAQEMIKKHRESLVPQEQKKSSVVRRGGEDAAAAREARRLKREAEEAEAKKPTEVVKVAKAEEVQEMETADEALRDPDVSMSPAAKVADDFLRMRGMNPQLAYVAFRDANLSMLSETDRAEALKIMEALRDEYLREAAELQSKYPNGYALLQDVSKTGSPAVKELAQALLKTVSKEKLEAIQVILHPMKNQYKNGVISLMKDAGAHSQLHELVHAITVREMEVNKDLRDYVNKLRKQAIQYAKSNGILTPEQAKILSWLDTSAEFHEHESNYRKKYGEEFWGANRHIAYALLNHKEFLSQAYSSYEFRRFLREQPGSGRTNMFTELFNKIKEFFGFSTKSTVLDEVLQLVPEIAQVDINENTADTEASYALKEREGGPVAADVATRMILKDKGTAKSMKENILKHGRNIKNFAEDIARPISDRILAIDKKMWGSLIKFETDSHLNTNEYSRDIKPFLQYLDTLTESQRTLLGYALLNSHLTENQKIIKNMVPKDAWAGVVKMLDKIKQRAIETGTLSEDDAKEFYFPRRVIDLKGLMSELHKDDPTGGILGMAFRAEAARLNVSELTQDQKVQVMTDMFHTGHFRNLPRPGGVKERSVPHVSPETFKFYSDPADALMGHIHEMNEKLGVREFIGDSRRKEKLRELKKDFQAIEKMANGDAKNKAILEYDLKASKLEDLETELQSGIAGLVVENMQGKSWDEQQEVINLINARIRQKGAHGVVDLMRNVSYITTLGNFLSAITQFSEVTLPMHAYGVNASTLKGIKAGWANLGKIIMNDLTGRKVAHTGSFVEEVDFTRQLQEFSSGNISSKWVERAFKWSGLTYADLVGKEAFMNSSWNYWKDPKNKEEFMKKFEPILGKDLDETYNDIQKDKRSRNAMAVLIAELSGYQPLTLSQMPKGYLENGNMRIFYMLKTFTLRATGRAIMEATERYKKAGVEFEKGNIKEGMKLIEEGTRRAAALLMLYAVSGAAADELKDILRGRDARFVQDNVYDNLLKFFFLSKYTLDTGYKQDAMAKTILTNLIPPTRYADNFIADITALVSGDKEFKAKSLQMMPLIGTVAFSNTAAGQKSFHSREREAILEAIRDNKKAGRSPYSGGLSQQISEYNAKVSKKDEKITNDSVQRTYKGKKNDDKKAN